MKLHDLKLSSEFCSAVYFGSKTFEIRLNDRDYAVGDIVRFIPWNADDVGVFYHPVVRRSYEIRYLYNIPDSNYVVFSIFPLLD